MKLTAKNVYKRFGATVALDNASVVLHSGEVHALAGENGAGKSTLLKVIAAVHKPDSAQIFLDDEPFQPKDFLDASAKGVTIVFQESTINPYVSIAENIFIDRLRIFNTRLGNIQWPKIKKDAQELLDSMGADIHVNQDVRSLDLGQWKLIEVARALAYKPKVLLLDESTAFLNNKEVQAFLSVINTLRDQGLAIGFVSHHLNEVFEISDRITIMRDGKYVVELNTKEATSEQIEAAMVGREIGSKLFPARPAPLEREPVLHVEGLSVKDQVEDVSFDLKRGEILGIGGLKGAGGEAVLEAIYGTEPIVSGCIRYGQEKYKSTTPNKSLARRIAMVPGERTLEGLIPEFSIRDNLVMAALPKKGLFRDKKEESGIAREYVDRIRIKTNDVNNPANSLSGGNMQKVVLGKFLAATPNILLLNNPTRGIDVSARQEIYTLMREIANSGVSIIMLTEDLLELLGMSDRIIIMRKKTISKVYEQVNGLTEADIIGSII
jgi:ABC-type sugar transport system ATPase subunit